MIMATPTYAQGASALPVMCFAAAASGVLLPVLAVQLAKKRGAMAMARAHSIDSIRSCVLLFRDDVVVVVVADCGWSLMVSWSLSLCQFHCRPRCC
jgi:uncharacterized membrane protein YdbT with pleckstrin-like domain